MTVPSENVGCGSSNWCSIGTGWFGFAIALEEESINEVLCISGDDGDAGINVGWLTAIAPDRVFAAERASVGDDGAGAVANGCDAISAERPGGSFFLGAAALVDCSRAADTDTGFKVALESSTKGIGALGFPVEIFKEAVPGDEKFGTEYSLVGVLGRDEGATAALDLLIVEGGVLAFDDGCGDVFPGYLAFSADLV